MQYGKTYLVRMAQGDIEYGNSKVPECVKQLHKIKDQISAKLSDFDCDDFFSEEYFAQAEKAEKQAKADGYFRDQIFNPTRNRELKTWNTPKFRAVLQAVNEGAGELTIYKK